MDLDRIEVVDDVVSRLESTVVKVLVLVDSGIIVVGEGYPSVSALSTSDVSAVGVAYSFLLRQSLKDHLKTLNLRIYGTSCKCLPESDPAMWLNMVSKKQEWVL